MVAGQRKEDTMIQKNWQELIKPNKIEFSSKKKTEAYCESMCVFLLLSGKTRYVPDTARVRVHQIWMGDRADDAKAASYSAQDMMIVERDIGRLAKYTFDMGGTGDLLSLALSVPPWEDLHQLSRAELRLSNLVTTDLVADVLPRDSSSTPIASTTASNVSMVEACRAL